MKWAMRGAGAFAALALALYAPVLLASEQGEVIVLTSRDAAGTTFQTGLWIVDLADGTYLRAGDAQSGWFGKVREHPRVVIERGDTALSASLQLRQDNTPRVNAALRRKYGFADRSVALIMDPEHRTALRINPAVQ